VTIKLELFGDGDGSPVADDCGIADDHFEPFIDVPTSFGEGTLWVIRRPGRVPK
jgi:hypothetical protein